jgi:hypothetical protein
MGRSPYQSEKRRKELARLQKQEEKRQRRFAKRHASAGTTGEGEPADAGQPADAPATGDDSAPGTGAPPQDEAPAS